MHNNPTCLRLPQPNSHPTTQPNTTSFYRRQHKRVEILITSCSIRRKYLSLRENETNLVLIVPDIYNPACTGLDCLSQFLESLYIFDSALPLENRWMPKKVLQHNLTEYIFGSHG